MSDTKNTTVTTPDQSANGTTVTTPEEKNRTYTQTELESIVEKRLKREREKYADYEELKTKASAYDEAKEAEKTDLQKATELAEKYRVELEGLKKAEGVRDIRDKVSKETGVPASMLTFDTEEECTAQAQGILAFAQPKKYPTLPDKGEVTHSGSAAVSSSEKFAEWFNNSVKIH